ncbi:MAG: hypothetical protein U0X91_10195 [Spirosomataceae bacterium]
MNTFTFFSLYVKRKFPNWALAGILLFSFMACNDNGNVGPAKGVVKGRVTNGEGKPVANAEIIANSTDYYNKTSTGYTNAEGYYEIQLPNGIAEGSYSTEGTVTVKYHGKNYTLALYNEDTRVFSAYDGAVRNFIFRLTGKRNADDDAAASPLGGKLEVRHDFNTLERSNIEVALQPDGPLVDGSVGKKIVKMLSENDDYLHDIPVGNYKITARDVVTKETLGITLMDSFKTYTSSVTGLFTDDDFIGSTHFRLAVNIGKL